jgi:hypothetical protein
MLDIPGSAHAPGIKSSTESGGFSVPENTGSLDISLVLERRPSADVKVGVSISDTSVARISPSEVTFTNSDWNTPHVITVIGMDNYVKDGNKNVSVLFSPAVSADPSYKDYQQPSVPVTVIDDETASIVVTPVSGLVTTESGGTARFAVVLSSKPVSNVVIPSITSSNTSEGIADKTSLTFTPDNWNIDQTVTLTGVDDKITDGNVDYTVTLGDSVSADPNYDKLVPAIVYAQNCDDKGTLGIVVTSESGGYAINENGGSVKVDISLQRKPDSDVTVPLSLSSTSRASISSTGLTFTKSNWNSPQTVTVNAIDNHVADGNITTQLVFGYCVSTDPAFSGYRKDSQGIVVIDDESASIVVSSTSGSTTLSGVPATSESGAKVTFTVSLASEPTANVVIPTIASSNPAEGTVDKSSLTFTPANWNTPQTVTVTGVEDQKWDGNIAYQITLANSVSSDTKYNDTIFAPISVTNIDNDIPAVIVSKPLINLTEGGSGTTFTVMLANMPRGDVTLPVSLSSTRASIDKTSLTFTSTNWNTPQTVTVSTINNSKHDGAANATIVIGSAGTEYNSVDAPDISLTVNDDDSWSIVFGSLSRHTNENLQNATFTVRIGSQPSSDVVVNLNEKYSVNNGSNQEGTIDKTSLTFTSANWNTPQTVTVTGVDDEYADGNQVYQIKATTSTADTDYSGVTNTFAVTNDDNDSASLKITQYGSTSTITANSVTFTGMATDDMNLLGSAYATWKIRLGSRPFYKASASDAPSDVNVTVTLTNNSTHSDGVISVDGVQTNTLTFTKDNWNTDQTVTVTGSSDGTNEGALIYTVSTGITTTDAVYGSTTYIKRPAFQIFSCDNDGANKIAYCRKSGGFGTSESGGSATFWFVPQSIPSADETMAVATTDTYSYLSSQVIASITAPASGYVTMSSSNYNVLDSAGMNAVIVKGNDDGANPYGGQYFKVYSGTSSPNLSFQPGDLQIINSDNDQVVEFGNASGNTSESGTTATFGVRLKIAPASGTSVTFTVSPSTTAEGTFSAQTLTFDNANYSTWQTISVTGVDDHKVDGTQDFYAAYGSISSTDERLDGYSSGTLFTGIRNTDNDKLIWVTDSPYYGNMGSGVAQADIASNTTSDLNYPNDSKLSGSTYKALIVDGVNRVARISSTGGTGQLNWVLQPNTEYYLKTGSFPYTTKIFTTDSYGIPGTFSVGFSSSSSETFWTGLNTDWTSSSSNCGLWKADNTSGVYGVGGATDSTAICAGTGPCTDTRKIIAVQQ